MGNMDGMEQEARRLLAERVRELRKARRWSQERLAEASGLHRTYIGGIERAVRNCGLDTLARLAHGFGISMAELVDFPDISSCRSQEDVTTFNGKQE